MNARDLAPYKRLAAALKREPFTDDELADLRDRLDAGASSGRLLGNLRAGRPSRVDVYIAAHAVKGWDPLTSRTADAQMPPPKGPLQWWFLAAALKGSRLLVGGAEIPQCRAALLAGVTGATWCRAEGWRLSSDRKPLDVTNLLRLCAYLDRHPHHFCVPAAVSFTGNKHCNALKSQASASAEQPAA